MDQLSSQFHSETAWCFPGLQECFQEFSKQLFDFPDEVMDDMDGEQETLAVQEDTNALDGDVEGETPPKEDVQIFDSTASSSQPIAPASTSNLIDKVLHESQSQPGTCRGNWGIPAGFGSCRSQYWLPIGQPQSQVRLSKISADPQVPGDLWLEVGTTASMKLNV